MAGAVVDLSQPLCERTVLWPGSRPFLAETVSGIERDGAYARVIRTPEHAGTHLDAPAHFAFGGRAVDQIPAQRLVAQGVKHDVSDRCADDPDFALCADDLEELESRDGRIPEGSAFLLRTGWEELSGDPDRYLGGSSTDALRFPGFGASAARLLVERGVVGIGIDTLSVDTGRNSSFPVHHVTLPSGLWHLEGLVNLDALPSRGFLVFAGAIALSGGSGAPARVLALLS